MPKAKPNQAAFLCWDYLLKTICVQGPFLLRSSYQLIPTDFAIIKHSSIHFLLVGVGGGGGAEHLLLFNSFLLQFFQFFYPTTYWYISLLGMLGFLCL